jgi:hypothetical protein
MMLINPEFTVGHVNGRAGDGLQPALAGAGIVDVGRSASRRLYRVSVALFAEEWD